jgi:hypothetical protein
MPQIPSKHAPELAARPASAIRRVAVPLTAPPYDDEPDGHAREGNGASPGRGPAAARGLPGAGQGAAAAPGTVVSPAAAGGTGHPGAWPGQFAQMMAETLAGSRPPHQLTPWTTEQARRRIRQLGPRLATGERPRVRRVMTSAPASDVLEVTAVVGFGPRTRVLALRLERQRGGSGRWCCTAIDSA